MTVEGGELWYRRPEQSAAGYSYPSFSHHACGRLATAGRVLGSALGFSSSTLQPRMRSLYRYTVCKLIAKPHCWDRAGLAPDVKVLGWTGVGQRNSPACGKPLVLLCLQGSAARAASVSLVGGWDGFQLGHAGNGRRRRTLPVEAEAALGPAEHNAWETIQRPFGGAGPTSWVPPRSPSWAAPRSKGSYLVDPASSHMLVSKIKPCMSKYKLLYTVKLRMAH